VELQGRLDDLRTSGLGLAAISYDPPGVLADFSARRGITFPLLSDAGSAIIRRYGLLNTTIDPAAPLYGYPFPGTFIVDRHGVVTSRVFEPLYQERHTLSSVLVRLGHRLDVPATKIHGAHLDVTSYASDRIAAPGTHFSLVLDITPAAHVHVYAPNASGYMPITLSVQPQAGLVMRALQLPAPEDYFFRPLGEHVPVHARPFRVVQDVMLDPSREGSAALSGVTTMTITGALAYQACDDRVCFPPTSVPLSWLIGVKPLDVERVKRPK
jgi:hypothetical protein